MTLDPQLLLPALIAAGIFLLVGFPLHEFSHALVADRLGDRTARYMEYHWRNDRGAAR